jgi:XTP/dITP diphosphohydrolase
MKVVLASNNPGKIDEFSQLLEHLPITFIPQAALGIKDVAETGLTFIENALIKARYACHITGLPTIADDSGLTVPALRGAPGVLSARYASNHATPEENIKKLLDELKGIPAEKRDACFYCVLVFMPHAKDPTPLVCEGQWSGTIAYEPKGSQGFGYDSVFYVPSEKKTAAELLPAIKNRISHRGIALQSFINQLPGNL